MQCSAQLADLVCVPCGHEQNSPALSQNGLISTDAFVEYVPLGVMGVIAPWNYPVSAISEHP